MRSTKAYGKLNVLLHTYLILKVDVNTLRTPVFHYDVINYDT